MNEVRVSSEWSLFELEESFASGEVTTPAKPNFSSKIPGPGFVGI
jgi:hypothetical protein